MNQRIKELLGTGLAAIIIVLAIALGIGVIVGLFVGPGTAYRHYRRYQLRMDARNAIIVNAIRIRQTQQLVEVEGQKAAVRVKEAEGIAKAQEIINASLTDRYLQHEAIAAQKAMAGSPNHTQIYIPVGTNGIPLIKTIGPSG